MSGEIGTLARGSIQGLPPSAVREMKKNGIDATDHLDHRGVAEFAAMEEMERERKKMGCVEAVLGLPGIREVRKILPQELKRGVKDRVRQVFFGDSVEP